MENEPQEQTFADVGEVIAANLRRLRTARRMSLATLASRADVAKATLANLEQGRGNPTIETLWSLALGLGVAFSDLLEDRRETSTVIVRAQQGARVRGSTAGGQLGLRLVDRIERGGLVEVFDLFLPARTDHLGRPHGTGVVERVFVHAGTITVGPASEPITLGPGDYARYGGDGPHVYRSAGEDVRGMLLVAYPPALRPEAWPPGHAVVPRQFAVSRDGAGRTVFAEAPERQMRGASRDRRGNSMNLTDQQIARFVEQGGFTGGDRATAIAVVLAESGGNSAARGDTTLETSVWGPSIGLFQIRSLWAQRGTGGQRDEVANLDPATNARHAHQIFLDAGARFSPWSTFTNGAYQSFLGRARAAAGNGGGPVTVPGDGGVHIVQAGETLSGIASSHGLSLDQLRALNPGLFDAAHQHGNMIQPGERVILSGHAGHNGGTGHAGQTYVVRSGDTLSGIASSHGLTLDRVRALNPGLFDAAHHNGSLIHPGEVVTL